MSTAIWQLPVESAEVRSLPGAGTPMKQFTRDSSRAGFEARDADKIFESTYSERAKGKNAA